MFCYINQLHTRSLSIGLFKTKDDFIVRSLETNLGEMNAGGNCD